MNYEYEFIVGIPNPHADEEICISASAVQRILLHWLQLEAKILEF